MFVFSGITLREIIFIIYWCIYAALMLSSYVLARSGITFDDSLTDSPFSKFLLMVPVLIIYTYMGVYFNFI